MLLTFDFKTIEEAQEFLQRLMPAPQSEFIAMTATDPAPAPSPEPVPKKRGRPSKKSETSTPSGQSSPVDVTRSYTIDDCRQALGDVLDAKGYDEAERILKAFGAARIGALPPEKFDEFIITCQATLG